MFRSQIPVWGQKGAGQRLLEGIPVAPAFWSGFLLGHMGSLHFKRVSCVSSLFLPFLLSLLLHHPECNQTTVHRHAWNSSPPLPSGAAPGVLLHLFETVFSSVKWVCSDLPQRWLGGLGGVKCVKHLSGHRRDYTSLDFYSYNHPLCTEEDAG